jgi:hypothetical protein
MVEYLFVEQRDIGSNPINNPIIIVLIIKIYHFLSIPKNNFVIMGFLGGMVDTVNLGFISF